MIGFPPLQSESPDPASFVLVLGSEQGPGEPRRGLNGAAGPGGGKGTGRLSCIRTNRESSLGSPRPDQAATVPQADGSDRLNETCPVEEMLHQ